MYYCFVSKEAKKSRDFCHCFGSDTKGSKRMDDKSKRKIEDRGGNVKEMAIRLQALSTLIK